MPGRFNRANQKSVDDHNRKVAARNKREIDRVNRANQKSVDDHNRKVGVMQPAVTDSV